MDNIRTNNSHIPNLYSIPNTNFLHVFISNYLIFNTGILYILSTNRNSISNTNFLYISHINNCTVSNLHSTTYVFLFNNPASSHAIPTTYTVHTTRNSDPPTDILLPNNLHSGATISTTSYTIMAISTWHTVSSIVIEKTSYNHV